MNYNNKPCPGCGAHMHDDDDIVVCPVCATPQHRSCWSAAGHCVNEEKHAEGYVWTADEKTEEFDKSGQEEVKTSAEPESEFVICPVCGSENPGDARHCGACGSPISTTESKQEEPKTIRCRNCGAENPGNASFCNRCAAPLRIGSFGYGPQGAFNADIFGDENEKIGERTAGELALYLRTSISKYLEKFRRIENGKRVGFNWAAFFFGPFWFLYRKLYKAGIVVIISLAAVSLIMTGYSTQYQELYEEVVAYESSYSEENADAEALQEQGQELFDKYKNLIAPYAVTIGLEIVIRIIGAMFADTIYYEKIKSDINIIEEEIPDRGMQMMMIKRRGGVSVMNIILAYCLTYFAEYGFSYLGELAVRIFAKG